MPDAAKHWNGAAVWALVFAIGALSTNFVFFVNPPMPAALPWLSLLLAMGSLVFLGVGLRHTGNGSHGDGGKALSVVLGMLTLLFAGASLYSFSHARALPKSAKAPQIGEHVPDFTLSDINGQPVSLDSLFQPPPGDPSSPAPNAVLLIFYRGYW
jgi:ABC-type multidrug transport system permease subunit